MIPLLQILSVVIHHGTQKGHRLLVRCPPPPLLPPPLVLGVFAPPGVEDKAFRRRLAKPWESSYAIRYLVPFCTTSSHGHTDAHHGSLSSLFFSLSPLFLPSFSLGPRSPASYTRGSQESATTPHSSIKHTQPVSEAHLAGRRSRFSHADAPVQHNHRQSENRDVGMRRARTDDVSHSARYVDDIPSSRSMSDIRGDDDTPTHPASDAQRTFLSHPIQHPSSCQRRLAYMHLCFFHRIFPFDIQDQDQGKGRHCLHRERPSTRARGRPLPNAAEVILWDLPAKLQPRHLKIGIRVG